jgi:hypothetical protein
VHKRPTNRTRHHGERVDRRADGITGARRAERRNGHDGSFDGAGRVERKVVGGTLPRGCCNFVDEGLADGAACASMGNMAKVTIYHNPN